MTEELAFLLDFVRIICNHKAADIKFVEDMLVPRQTWENDVRVLLVGGPGCGKSTFVKLVHRLLGESTKVVFSTTNVVGVRRIATRSTDSHQISCSGEKAYDNAYFDRLYEILNQPQAIDRFAGYIQGGWHWKKLRSYWRARWICVFWLSLLSRHMAPGGKLNKRDREAYEAD